MSALALEELSAIAAIYCGREECEVLEVSETNGISFRIQTSVKGSSGTDVLLKLLFHLPLSYPSSLPNISLHSEQLTRTQCLAVRARLLEEAASHLSQPMVHELILWIEQNFLSVIKEAEIPACDGQSAPSVKTPEDDDIWTVLVHLDHMRAKGKYIKMVEKWCRDLDLAGRLMFMGKMILILLQGDKQNIKVHALLFVAGYEYVILQKTSKVDVDSSGKKCKEKMMSVLFETKVQAEHRRFQAFEVKEYSTLDELQHEFEAAGLGKLFSEFVSVQL
ncbi:RWD domain-containing protein 3, partial [Ophiophagus hannah]